MADRNPLDGLADDAKGVWRSQGWIDSLPRVPGIAKFLSKAVKR